MFFRIKCVWILNDLKDTILSFISINNVDIDFGLQFFKEESFKKGTFLLKPNEYIDTFYFISNGCVSYYTIEDGKTQVMELFTEGYFFTDLYAYIEEIPSNAYLEVLEDLKVYAILKEDQQKIFDYSHEFERFGRLSMQRAFVNNFRRINELRSLSNQERYLQLLEKRPDLFQRVPQYLIASYLGLTPVGLSKIRKRLSQV